MYGHAQAWLAHLLTAPNSDCPGMDAIEGTPNPPTERPVPRDRPPTGRQMVALTCRQPRRKQAFTGVREASKHLQLLVISKSANGTGRSETKKLPSLLGALAALDVHWHRSVPHMDHDLEPRHTQSQSGTETVVQSGGWPEGLGLQSVVSGQDRVGTGISTPWRFVRPMGTWDLSSVTPCRRWAGHRR